MKRNFGRQEKEKARGRFLTFPDARVCLPPPDTPWLLMLFRANSEAASPIGNDLTFLLVKTDGLHKYGIVIRAQAEESF